MNMDTSENEQQSPDRRNSLDTQLAEYSACNDGYNSRDTIVFWEFSVLVAIFSGLLTVMTYIARDLTQPLLLFIAINALGFLGLLSLLGISIDMQSAHSCKVAIRDRMENIEMKINESSEPIQLWSIVIKERNVYALEWLSKIKTRETLEKEVDFLNISSYIIILLWIIVWGTFVDQNFEIICWR